MVHVTRPGILAAARRSTGSQRRGTGCRAPPRVARESYLGMYALVGILGGVTAAIHWLMLCARLLALTTDYGTGCNGLDRG